VNVVDSSAWLEFFAGGPNAGRFAAPIATSARLLVPTLSIYEVFKRILQQRGDDDALQAVAIMEQGRVVDLDRSIALAAARISIDRGLPLADSIMLATARSFQATFWTQDADFEGIDDVKYFARLD
jgi:predicted nucleic acid-binding protein